MLVSIIIPSYRQPHFLGRAIASCLEQDYEELEVIVVDDHSRDASLAVALSYANGDPRVQVVECGENGGLGKARNVGLAHASGDYLCFLDSDDYLLDRSISARVDSLADASAQHGSNVAGVYGDWQHVAESVDYPVVRAPRAVMPLVSADTYSGENVFICSAPLVRRDAVLAAGGFPEGLRMLEDFALWAKMIAAGAIFVPVHHVVATYRQRPNSMLRGDGLVVMADHVRVINDWAAETNDLQLADGGAMTAWLADETPFSYGRMSWNVPSVLGNFGGGAGAASVQSGSAERTDFRPPIDDFMTDSITSGLDEPWPLWTANGGRRSELSIVVSSIEESIEAVGIAALEGLDSSSVTVFATTPDEWSMLWPLSLAGYAVRPASQLSEATKHLDLTSPRPREGDSDLHFNRGLDVLWPDQLLDAPSPRSGSVVYVPTALDGYPALDAWISSALHVLADANRDPRIVCDPEMYGQLGGYRREFVSIDALRRATLVVSPSGDHESLVKRLTRSEVFDPSVDGDHARTSAQLRERVSSRT